MWRLLLHKGSEKLKFLCLQILKYSIPKWALFRPNVCIMGYVLFHRVKTLLNCQVFANYNENCMALSPKSLYQYNNYCMTGVTERKWLFLGKQKWEKFFFAF